MNFNAIDAQRQRILVSFCILFVIGLPFWWKFTQVYRASLPYDRIDQLNDWDITFPITVRVHTTLDTSPLEQALSDVLAGLDTRHVHYRLRFEHDQQPFGKVVRPHGVYDVYLNVQDQHPTRTTIQADGGIKVDLHPSDVATELVKTVLTDIFQQKHQRLLSYAFRTNQNDGMKQVVKHASRYKVILSLMNEDPTTLALDWDIYTAVQSYLQPFLSAVSPVFNVSLATQIQYFTKPALVMEPHPVTNESYYLWNTLPNFINSEWNLASVTEKHPILNFCVFVPALKHQPLSLYLDYEQRMQEPLAYLVSQWGGVTFLNTPSMQGYQTLSTDTLRPVMATILTQMRTLFGIQPLHSTLDNVQIDVAPHSGITRWELDSLLRMYTTRALVNTVNTLQSLSRMVQNLQHMVIQDHIDNKIQSSIHLVQEAQRHLEQGDYVQAMHVSAQAHILAEEAFFDPTMVGMLYFPDEHKYAVYMPLFIPIAVPLIMALLREFRLKQKIKTD